MGRKSINMEGQKIHQLIVLKKDEEKTKKGRGIWWICQCECGNVKSIRGCDLRTGRVHSCGCYNKKINYKIHYVNLKGQKFGKLTVIEDTEKITNNRHRIWKCQCDCGTVIEVSSDKLTTGNTQSCGCLKSKGEEKIGELLNQANISFEKEKTFLDCKNINSLRFDFYIPSQNCLIEFDGIQHFKNIEHFGGGKFFSVFTKT